MKKPLIFSAFLILAVFLVSGCSDTISRTTYSFSPAWTRNSNVVFIKQYVDTTKNTLGTETSQAISYYLTRISKTGTSELSIYSLDTPNIDSIVCSPTEDKVAYLTDLRSGSYDTIIVKNISTGTHTGTEKVEIYESDVLSIDWSSDGTKLIFANASGEVNTIGWDGGNKAPVMDESADATWVRWKYGNKFVIDYTDTAGTKTMVVSSDASTTNNFGDSSVTNPEISGADNTLVYGMRSGNYVKVNTAASNAVTTVVSDFSGTNPQLSPDGTLLLYETSEGIYVRDIAAGTVTKIN